MTFELNTTKIVRRGSRIFFMAHTKLLLSSLSRVITRFFLNWLTLFTNFFVCSYFFKRVSYTLPITRTITNLVTLKIYWFKIISKIAGSGFRVVFLSGKHDTHTHTEELNIKIFKNFVFQGKFFPEKKIQEFIQFIMFNHVNVAS